MEKQKYNIGIVGGTSLLAGYLLKYLIHHPFINLKYIDSEYNPGDPIFKFHKNLDDDLKNRKLDKYSPDFIKKNLDLVFIAKPHTKAMKYVQKLYNEKIKIIDLSGDFRIKNISEYEKWYKAKHNVKELVSKSIYGLTEIYKDQIKNSLLVANPGCYPTGILLSLYPLIKKDIIQLDSINITSLSGVSGAGKNYVPGKNLFLDAFNNIIPYKITEHQHTPEIEEQLNFFNENKKNIKVNFVPQIACMENGIYNTIYLKLKKEFNNFNNNDICSIYKEYYSQSCFIKIFQDIPQIKDVVNTNNCLIFSEINKRTETLIILNAIDNRIKGGAGQAIQNMNFMLGFNEEISLI